MAGLVHRVVEWLPPSWQSAIERESREWRARCPRCLQETSVWEQGGIRFKAAGSPFRTVRCGHCDNSFLGQLYRVGPSLPTPQAHAATATYSENSGPPTPVKPGWGVANGALPATSGGMPASDCKLWIDGAGSFLVLAGDAITIGSPAAGRERPDVAIMAAISRRHVQIVRIAEGYSLRPVDHESARPGSLLRSGEPFEIGGGVQMRLRIPNPLSQSALLEVVSTHRMEPRCNGVILLDQVCVLGPGADAHLRSPQWSSSLILFRRDGQLWCKAIAGLQRNSEAISNEARLENGDVLTTDDLRLRVELSCGTGAV